MPFKEGGGDIKTITFVWLSDGNRSVGWKRMDINNLKYFMKS